MKRIYRFLTDLKKHNDRDWFNAHKDEYQATREAFIGLVQQLIKGVSGFDPSIADVDAKKAMFRIYRDVRFSHDKSPYKTHYGADINRGGRRSDYAGYYIHLEPGNSFAGGGIWHPQAEVLKAVRDEIVYNYDGFKELVNQDSFKKHFGSFGGERLKRPPKGYDPDFEGIEYLKQKDFVLGKQIDDKLMEKPEWLMDELLATYKAMFPWIGFVNFTVDEMKNKA